MAPSKLRTAFDRSASVASNSAFCAVHLFVLSVNAAVFSFTFLVASAKSVCPKSHTRGEDNQSANRFKK
jgi:hypothetical protein